MTPVDPVDLAALVGREAPAVVEAIAEQNLETGTGRVVLLFAMLPIVARAFLSGDDARKLAASLMRLADVVDPTPTSPTRH